MADFYNQATLVITLTNPQMAIETFGLTTLEAMSNALPVIVPTKGGIAEMVVDGENGYKTDVQRMDVIERQIKGMMEDADLYHAMAAKALEWGRRYDGEKTNQRIEQILENA